MADGNGPGRISVAGLAFAALMLVLILVSIWLFIARPWWFPELASVRGGDIDGVFGRTDPKLISQDDSNPIGLDRRDPAAKDDVIAVEMHAVVNQPVKVRLRSKDVIHSFFLPRMRYKQDAVPGMAILIWYTPTQTGKFEIACAELCGNGHYRMRAFLFVEKTEQDLNNWLKQQLAEQVGN